MLTLFAILICLSFLYYLVKATRLPGETIYSAFFIRTVFASLAYFSFIELPGVDSGAFLRRAAEFSHYNWQQLLNLLSRPGGSPVFPALGALVYKTSGIEDPLAATILLSVFPGTLVVIFTYFLSKVLFGKQRAKQVAWIAALFPPVVLNASIFNREALAAAPFTLGLYYVARWHQPTGKLSDVLGAVICLTLATWVHGGFAFAFIGLIVLALWGIVRIILDPAKKLKKKRIFVALAGFSLLSLLTISLLASQVTLGKIGDIGEAISSADEVVDAQLAREVRGGSGYPPFAQNILPIRIIYFLFSPFPWDIRSARMLQGFIATAVFIYLAVSIFKSIKNGHFRGRSDVVAVSIVLAISIFVFAVGTSNIGTSIRHRSKFLYGLLGLSAATVFKSADPSRRKSYITTINHPHNV